MTFQGSLETKQLRRCHRASEPFGVRHGSHAKPGLTLGCEIFGVTERIRLRKFSSR
ncbi:hypothetical protein RISK_005984 [Rhodopirellula islandica]|uniref:Uncharacterized protein n=1 Tax=Rhodopirellula islandica TaxID=595434 RepID=A0A0J1B4M3_RHOIS|nr:hypothetical protein RISK_005984 [Rhodopirellula islandica]